MHCRVCGCTQFVSHHPTDNLHEAPNDTEIECAHCGFKTSKGQLIQDNSEAIEASIEDMKDEIIEDLFRKFRKGLK